MRQLSKHADQITIVVPAFNEETHIGRCIASLDSQSYPRDRYNIIVVDNGSTDRTCQIVNDSPATLLRESRRSAYWARNLAIEKSQGDWLAFTDADCIAEPTWLENLHRRAVESGAWMVGGLTKYDVVRDTMGNRLLYETHLPDQLRTTIETYHCVAGGNMFVRREAFERFGPFRVVRSGSDIEMSKRLAAQNHPSVFAEDAVVRHQCDLSNWEYLRRSYRIRFGQRMHSSLPHGMAAAARQLTTLPWQPGFRAGAQSVSIQHLGPPPGFVKQWLFRWATRWAGFLGELHGTIAPRQQVN
ncbi:MAG: glycosyltransferase family 2 protein [Planctomycetales bacterium]|nr:glycosyltransferase family 2 protein [Planctomycetales bacterium]